MGKIKEEVPEEPEETEEIKAPEAISFLDVKESDWFYDAVSYAIENGLMSGISEDIFAPNPLLTTKCWLLFFITQKISQKAQNPMFLQT